MLFLVWNPGHRTLKWLVCAAFITTSILILFSRVLISTISYFFTHLCRFFELRTWYVISKSTILVRSWMMLPFTNTSFANQSLHFISAKNATTCYTQKRTLNEGVCTMLVGYASMTKMLKTNAFTEMICWRWQSASANVLQFWFLDVRWLTFICLENKSVLQRI